jgi:phosphoserine phosphatase RsbX
MASRTARKVVLIDVGIASCAPDDNAESGDLSVVYTDPSHALLAAIDGIGHGKSAAMAARAAADILESFPHEPLITLVHKCHESLRSTRGVVLSLASIDFHLGTLTWLGVGNVQGILIRSTNSELSSDHSLLLRPGVVGSQLPALQTATLPISVGDTLAFATDGIRGDFTDDLFPNDTPQRLADKILAKNGKGNDDALIFVARFTGRAL